ncbi:DNA-binding response regulator [Methylophaga nitratireducenticrescens]|uniref:Two component Transcriptional regulator n=1 Tax=Methylophaga nitratireducenticrescens TaxID=754476 RepID=I1XGN3_METNJ|nr:response regulator transcription factor [Methylophaga nitratireducenticrescens]AFI83552.1 DNA-binding response regulator [Methylophaga nitratireducenticrescens]
MNIPSLAILIVEDQVALAENLFEFFEDTHYELDFAADGLTALHLLATNDYDVIVLDIMLPGLSGYEICRRVRQDLKKNTPIIMVTAKGTLPDKEEGFGVGADDYLVKPFDLRELQLRIEALSRRQFANDSVKKVGSLSFDPGRLMLRYGDIASVELSGIAAKIIESLFDAYPKYLSHEVLCEQIWGSPDIETQTLRTHIYNLRQILQKSLGFNFVKTMHGRGYRLQTPEESGNTE